MDLSNIKLFSVMQNRMSYLGERQSVLAENIANASTPGYKPKDLKKVDFNELVNNQSGRMQMTATHAGHMQPSSGSSGGKFATETDKNLYGTTLSGNSVNIENQMLKMSQNAMDYQATTSLYKKMTSIMNIAIGGQR